MTSEERLKADVECYEKEQKRFVSFSVPDNKYITEMMQFLNDNNVRTDEIISIIPSHDRCTLVLFTTGHRLDELKKYING